ncbi:2-amino-4-hydroxy-6-hydroxymethyldihydropteridine diphosphokinase [Nostoc sp. LEGE 06077]|uniref:2-amino-4-hydroxy-6- hydroxymethyldihydropteridine diphosphokinase n=1 Tax=Nostoc sp. LEGE 06077 TaxID=915325 RepID=UPI0018803391|nr:2-amino-4-hydroxy-6-hydroxymethyldihydropteridine diphosphokinase [Nostoc sp. LEGE 06077]MBE9205404.1 2-amino-4-hydroxy-6-hydroxymethyldihydropteridine diphosphokinase [Nostoc sp. LEGE 06077]
MNHPHDSRQESLSYSQWVRIAVALGSNLGESAKILAAAIAQLSVIPTMQLEATSSWYITKAVGPPQPDYINGCVIMQVDMTPQLLLETLLATEQQFGRVRQERWGPRSLDLDLLLYDQVILDTPTLQIPHPRMRERAFVLVPLAEIAPDWIEPVSGYTIKQLVKDVDCSDVHLLKSNSSHYQ